MQEEKGIKTDFNLNGEYANEFDNWLEEKVGKEENYVTSNNSRGQHKAGQTD
ncbi:hypothetical protein [Clostridium sp.]|uniref:hypothetical protein n=1 Tax=Clostridium sp. TaxID=1506 RepID=UPI0035A02895